MYKYLHKFIPWFVFFIFRKVWTWFLWTLKYLNYKYGIFFEEGRGSLWIILERLGLYSNPLVVETKTLLHIEFIAHMFYYTIDDNTWKTHYVSSNIQSWRTCRFSRDKPQTERIVIGSYRIENDKFDNTRTFFFTHHVFVAQNKCECPYTWRVFDQTFSKVIV